MISNQLDQREARVFSLEVRIARSDQQPSRDTRHDRWVKKHVWYRSEAAYLRTDLPVYQRLASFPWLPFPQGAWVRTYLDEQEVLYLNRTVDCCSAPEPRQNPRELAAEPGRYAKTRLTLLSCPCIFIVDTWRSR